jgi:cytochrome P450
MSPPLLGLAGRFRRNPIPFLQSTAAKYGDVSHFRVGLRHVYFLNRPDLIEEVLVTHEGNFTDNRMLGQGRVWRPVLGPESVAEYAEVVVDCGKRARTRWQSGQTIDVSAEMMRLTLEIACTALFGNDIDDNSQGVGRALRHWIEAIQPADVAGYLLSLLVRRATRAKRYISQCIQERIAQGGDSPGDLLPVVFPAADWSRRLSGKRVRERALSCLVSWYETTAAALTWALYLLSEHPEADQQMRQEIASVTGERLPGFEDVEKLGYTRRVFAETLRLYPPVWTLGRQSKSFMRLYNYAVPPGSVCVMSPYVMQRHPRFWPNPERFEPDRFAPEQAGLRPKFACFPFGGGARKCAGEGVAMMEGVLLLATLAQSWRFDMVSDQRVDLQLSPTLRPKYGMRMTCIES